MRNTVAITSQNIAPVEKMSMQRQNTSINDGNRKRGKNSDANCHSAITTMNGKTDVQTLTRYRPHHARRGGWRRSLLRHIGHFPPS